MKTTVIAPGIVLLAGFSLLACNVIKPDIPSVEKEQSHYRGKSFNVDVFVRIANDTAILDWFYEEKIPRFSFSDTLFSGRSANNIWESDSSKIYKKGNRLMLETKSPYIPPKPLICKLRLSDKAPWEKQWHISKNVYLLREEYLLFIANTTLNSSPQEKSLLWVRMIKQHGLNIQMLELNHRDFKLEFLKFKTMLMEEAHRVDPP